MAGFQCGVCGRAHDHLPRDIGYRRPSQYLVVPESERARRVYETDDLCVIDNQTFLIRGVLYLPIVGADEQFGWGVWAWVDEPDFHRYVEAWELDTEDQEPPFVGRLSSDLLPYPGSEGIELTVRLRSGGQRPLFLVNSSSEPLGIDQRLGITPEKAHSFVESFAQ